jgi:hypothetical protein
MTTPKYQSEVKLKAATETVPRRAMQLRDAQDVRISEGEDKHRKFSMVALTGKPIAHWWFGTLAIDLEGISMKQTLPVLKDHDTEQRLGFTTKLSVQPGRGLLAEGAMLDNDHAKQVLADHDQGFPWQASTYLQASEIQRLSEGETAVVNGQSVQGPAAIFRKSTLREVTFTTLGADDDTSATPLSSASEDQLQVAILLSNREPEQMDPIELAKQTEAQLKLARDDSTKAERARVLAILSQTVESQRDLALSLIGEGVSLVDSQAKINENLRAQLSASKVHKNDANVAPLSNGNAGNQLNDANATLAAANSPEGWEAQWTADAKLRADWDNDKALFLAERRAQGRVTKARNIKELTEA